MNHDQLTSLLTQLLDALEAAGELPKPDKPQGKQEQPQVFVIPTKWKDGDVPKSNLFATMVDYEGEPPKTDKPQGKQEQPQVFVIPTKRKDGDVPKGNEFATMIDYKGERSILILPYEIRKNPKQYVYLLRELHKQFDTILAPSIAGIEGEEVAKALNWVGIAKYEGEEGFSMLLPNSDGLNKEAAKLLQSFVNFTLTAIDDKYQKLERGETLEAPETEVFPIFVPPVAATEAA